MAAPRDRTTADDEQLLRDAAAGDDRAVEELLHRYRLFVRRKAQTYFVPGGDADDVIQEGMIGLYRAMTRFDPARGSFREFAATCVKSQILSAITSARRKGNLALNTSTPLDPLTAGDDTDAPVNELAAGDDPAAEVIWRLERSELARFVRASLSDFEQQVLVRYLAGQSYETIAAALNRGAKAVDNALQRIRRKVAVNYLGGPDEG